MTTASIYQPLRRGLTNAIGEAQSENPWINAGIALELCRAELEARFASVMVTASNGEVCDGSDFVRDLLSRP
jgi:hypothetical protein